MSGKAPPSSRQDLRSSSTSARGGQSSSDKGNAAEIPFIDLSSEQVAQGMVDIINQLQPIIPAWSKSPMNGKFLAVSTPSRVRSEMTKCFPSMENDQRASILNLLKTKILACTTDEDVTTLWNAVGSNPPDSRGGGVASHVVNHGGGENGSAASSNAGFGPPPPPIGQMFSPFGGNSFPPPPGSIFQQSNFQNPWTSPQLPQAKKAAFAFGRRDVVMSPPPVLNLYSTPNSSTNLFSINASGPSNPLQMAPASLSFNAAVSSNQPLRPSSQHHGFQGSANPSQINALMPPSNAPPEPSSQNLPAPSSQMPAPSGQGNALPPSNIQLPPSSGQYQALQQNLQLQQLGQMSGQQAHPNLAHQNQLLQQAQQIQELQQQLLAHQQGRSLGSIETPMSPWDLEAKQRGPALQDAGMMPGFSRRSITIIINHAIEKRQALSKLTAVPQVYKEVAYPSMSRFTAEEFLISRRAYFVAIRASIPSCIFKEFKECMTDKCRGRAMRKFKLNEVDWLALPDDKLLGWLNMLFGPKTKEEAINRLESVKFPSHSDASDSQATFLDKFDNCVYDFELVINDIADSHATWVQDPSKLATGELSSKEVMEIWRKKFPKQERNPFSVQIKECREFMERNKDALFNDIVEKINDHFAVKDAMVAEGKMHYSTTPTTRSQALAPPRSAGKFQHSSSSGEKQTFASKRPVPVVDSRAKRSRDDTTSKPARKVIPGHMRGISCGSIHNHFGLGCSATTCPFWGTKYDKNKDNHVFKDSDKEDSVLVDKAIYDGLLKAKPGILIKWAAAKDQQTKTKFAARVSAMEGGEEDPDSSSEGEEISESDIDAACDEFSQDKQTSDISGNGINDDECFVSALATQHTTIAAAALLAANKMQQFFGTSRVIDAENRVSAVKTLLDPGAEFNIVSPDIRDLCAIQTMPVQIAFFQGKKKQCVVEEIAECRFELQNANGEFTRHVEWCTVADLGYNLLLGRKFCFDNGFTNFDSLLRPWNEDGSSLMANEASTSALTADVAQPEGQASSIKSSPSQFVFLKFARVDVPVGDARHKRDPKALKCAVPLSEVNAISESELNASNPFSSIKILDTKVGCKGQEILLQFTVESENGDSASVAFKDWFRVDPSVTKGCVQLSETSQAASIVRSAGRIISAAVTPTVSNSTVHHPQSSAPERNSFYRDHTSKDDPINADVRKNVQRIRNQKCSGVLEGLAGLTPMRSNVNHGIIRFSRKDTKSRTALVVEFDDCIAHNVIDSRLLTTDKPASIVQLDRKDLPDVSMVLLEFSIQCANRIESNVRLHEWFRITNCADHRPKVIVRGIFDKSRLHEQQQIVKSNVVNVRAYSSGLKRDHAPTPLRKSESSSMPGAEREYKKLFAINAATVADNPKFISCHPISHHRLHRSNIPPLRPLYTKGHASSKVCECNNPPNKAMLAAIEQAELSHAIKQSLKVLNRVVEHLPEDVRKVEQADIASISARSSIINYEAAIDDIRKAHDSAKISSIQKATVMQQSMLLTLAGKAVHVLR